ncbi:MAG: hypothetical protein ACK55Z_29815, partial [bacterium]
THTWPRPRRRNHGRNRACEQLNRGHFCLSCAQRHFRQMACCRRPTLQQRTGCRPRRRQARASYRRAPVLISSHAHRGNDASCRSRTWSRKATPPWLRARPPGSSPWRTVPRSRRLRIR